MGINAQKYTGVLKLLVIVPFVWGILTFAELFMPTKMEENRVQHKSESFRVKTQKTTYTINFVDINDQFTKEIYDQLRFGDSVMLEVTPIHRQIKSVTPYETGIRLANSTPEFLAILAFGLAFILSGLIWFKKEPLSKRQFSWVSLLIIFSIISIVRTLI